jgi:methionine sulfoxide reductase heme-binding subunit
MLRAWDLLSRFVAAIINWRYFKPAVFLACAIPLADVAISFWLVYTGRSPTLLGAEPTKALQHLTGEDALAMLLLTLSVTPVRRLFGVNKIHNLRRMLGLWAFTYAAVHLSIYLVFDQLCYSPGTCELGAIWQDILKRKFIFVGQLAFFCLLLLALTSTAGWMRRLKKNWTRLHRLVYVAAMAGVIHFIWIQKSDIREPLNWAFWLAALLGIRVYFAVVRRRARLAATARA